MFKEVMLVAIAAGALACAPGSAWAQAHTNGGGGGPAPLVGTTTASVDVSPLTCDLSGWSAALTPPDNDSTNWANDANGGKSRSVNCSDPTYPMSLNETLIVKVSNNSSTAGPPTVSGTFQAIGYITSFTAGSISSSITLLHPTPPPAPSENFSTDGTQTKDVSDFEQGEGSQMAPYYVSAGMSVNITGGSCSLSASRSK